MTGNFCHQRWLLLLNWTSVLKDVYRNRSLLAWVRLPRTQFSTCSSWKPVTGYNYSIVHVPIHQKNSKSYLYREATTHMTYTEIKFQYGVWCLTFYVNIYWIWTINLTEKSNKRLERTLCNIKARNSCLVKYESLI